MFTGHLQPAQPFKTKRILSSLTHESLQHQAHSTQQRALMATATGPQAHTHPSLPWPTSAHTSSSATRGTRPTQSATKDPHPNPALCPDHTLIHPDLTLTGEEAPAYQEMGHSNSVSRSLGPSPAQPVLWTPGQWQAHRGVE